MEVNRKWKEDYDTLKLQYEMKNESLQQELDMTKEKLSTAETQVLALGSEVTRLATTLNQMYQREGAPSPSMVDLDDYEVFKQQVCELLVHQAIHYTFVYIFVVCPSIAQLKQIGWEGSVCCGAIKTLVLCQTMKCYHTVATLLGLLREGPVTYPPGSSLPH